MSALLSVHDVMPETLDLVGQILRKFSDLPRNHIYLLIVPGKPWSESQLETLKAWQEQGYQLAGHGWTHHIRRKTTAYHYLHALLVSRNVAEHLSLSSEELENLLCRNFQWFIDTGFEPPELYVPPAWALGQLTREKMKTLPFRYYETTSGIYDSNEDRFIPLLLTGYEADTGLRAGVLKVWNWLNLWLSRHKIIRISIHPYDLSYALANDISLHINRRRPLVQLGNL